jgi:glyoxylate reductase
MSDKPVVLLTSRYPDALVAELAAYATVLQGDDPDRGMPRGAALAQIGRAVAVVSNNELRIDAELLDRAAELRLVATATAGFDSMDVSSMAARRVWGTNAPDAYSADTATHAIALMLALGKRVVEADAYVRSGAWARDGWMPGGRWDGLAFEGRRFGVVGYGHIGKAAARRAEVFGMVVGHHSRSGRGDAGWMALEALLGWADVVSLHCPLTPQTRHLINAETLARMRPGALLINVARGKVVDLAALIPALRDGRLGGAGLDVFEDEPEVPEALRSLPNVVLSPHMGGCTQAARDAARRTCIENVLRVLRGQTLEAPVVRAGD